MSCIENDLILENLYEEELDFWHEQGFIGEQACIFASDSARDRFNKGDFNRADYEDQTGRNKRNARTRREMSEVGVWDYGCMFGSDVFIYDF